MAVKDVENAADARKPGDAREDAGRSPGSALMKARSSPIKLKPSKKGSLHTALGIAQGQPISGARLAAAARSTNADIKRKSVFAQNAKGWNH